MLWGLISISKFRAFLSLLGLKTDSRSWFVVFEIETLLFRGSCDSSGRILFFGVNID